MGVWDGGEKIQYDHIMPWRKGVSNATLITLIEWHVEKGSTIHSDGWIADCPLNELGYYKLYTLHYDPQVCLQEAVQKSANWWIPIGL